MSRATVSALPSSVDATRALLAGENYRCTLKQTEFIAAGEFAKRDHRTRESNRTNKGTDK
jgi:hypothetical protein